MSLKKKLLSTVQIRQNQVIFIGKIYI